MTAEEAAMILVQKRSGKQEPLDLTKLHKVVMWACEGVTGVSASEVEMRAHLQFGSNKLVKTSDIQEALIKAAADLISEDAPNYQYVAGRLINYHLRKGVYGQYEPIPFLDHIKKNIDAGFYDPVFLTAYTEEELNELGAYIKHDRDMDLAYAGMEQMRGKYLVKNRYTGEILETPQMEAMLIAAFLFQAYPKETRLDWVKDYYDAISTHDLSLPTPIMAGVRTPQRQFSSCVLIETGDDLNSIFTSAHAIGLYVAQKAGIGINAGALRAVGSKIRNGDATSTGVIPFWRVLQDAVKSCSQGGVRGGAATMYYPWWHYEVEDLLVLKNSEGTEFNRLRQMDYGIQFNKLAYERLLKGEEVSLFSPSEVPGLFEAFYADQDQFREIYERAERNTRLRKKKIKASDLFSLFMTQRKNTARVYCQNVDHSNEHGSFIEELAPIRMSNLCTEVTLPTKPLYRIDDPNGEIALCILSAINWGKIKSKEDFERPARLAVRALDALINLQEYPVDAAAKAAIQRRSLGIGIINFAYWLAKNNLTYQDIDEAGLALIDEYAEAWSYYLIKASVDLAEEQGACALNGETKYSLGVLPIDTYKAEVRELVPHVERMPWDELRVRLRKFGIRNSTLMALMPAETSAQIANATNGIEPALKLVTSKQSNDGVLPQVVPEFRRLKNKYDLRGTHKSPLGYLKIMAVLQKYIDQAISVNTSYNPAFYPDEQIPMSELLQHLVLSYRWGIKTLYYMNVEDGAGELEVPQEHCESCVI